MLKAKPKTSVSPEFMDEDPNQDDDQTPTPSPRSPFWIQTNNPRRLSAHFFNSFVLIIFLLLFALLSLLFIIPSLIRLSSNIFRPNLVKRSWDSVNFILVLVALVFGFLTRNISNDEYDRSQTEVPPGDPIMYDFQPQSIGSETGLRRQRTSVSYPDLRELSPPWNHRGAADPWRFSDDTHLNYYHVLEPDRTSFRQRIRQEHNSSIQNTDNFNSYTPSPEMVTPGEGLYFPPPQPPSQSPPPPHPSANTVNEKTKRVNRNVAGKLLSPETESSEKNGGKDERKRGNTEKRRARSSESKRIPLPVTEPDPDPTMPLLLSHKKKKRRQRDRSVDNLSALLHNSQQLPVKSQPPVPPPPAAARRVNYPPPATVTRVASFVTDRPGASLMTAGFNGVDDSSSGGESPMKHIPPPPPLPPFKMPDWKFSVEGDFVRLQSTLSSRSVSPDGDESRSPSSDVDTVAAAATAIFCPSSDVDTKADSFIARFRAGLKLERMSKLGPGPSLGPSYF